jgi:hypothetical protein
LGGVTFRLPVADAFPYYWAVLHPVKQAMSRPFLASHRVQELEKL